MNHSANRIGFIMDYFMGILMNVDSSILQVEPWNGFEIRVLNEKELIAFMRSFGESPWGTDELFRTLSRFVYCEGEHSAYYVTKTIEVDCADPKVQEEQSFYESIGMGDTLEERAMFRAISDFAKEQEPHLYDFLDLLHLFKEGGVHLIYNAYLERSESGRHDIFQSTPSLPCYSNVPFSLMEDEPRQLNDFLRITKLPFKYDYQKLAFDNFIESYRVSNTKLAFLSLMIALEALLSRSTAELKYSLCRNVAVLIGKDKDDSKNLSKQVGRLYEMRSSLVHGDSKTKNGEDIGNSVLELRNIVRESIKETVRLGWDKRPLMEYLTEASFGERGSRRYC